jgi:hypothetical protein
MNRSSPPPISTAGLWPSAVAQGHWGGLPVLFFEKGMPDIQPKMEFMGTAPSR